MNKPLSNSEKVRYARHLTLPQVGIKGQERLKNSSILVVGAGGLGSPSLLYLAAAGIGKIGIIDDDIVEITNLQRQVIHGTSSLGIPKVSSAKEKLLDLNPEISITIFNSRINLANALDIINQFDIIIDGTDNFTTRYLINDACVLTGKTNIHGSIFRFEGQVTVFKPKEGPCYRCLYPEPPPPGLVPNCQEGGVLGVLAGIIGNLQVVETLKLILGQGETLIGSLLLYDALKTEFRKLKLKRDPNCPICSDTPTITELIDYEEFCGLSR